MLPLHYIVQINSYLPLFNLCALLHSLCDRKFDRKVNFAVMPMIKKLHENVSCSLYRECIAICRNLSFWISIFDTKSLFFCQRKIPAKCLELTLPSFHCIGTLTSWTQFKLSLRIFIIKFLVWATKRSLARKLSSEIHQPLCQSKERMVSDYRST